MYSKYNYNKKNILKNGTNGVNRIILLNTKRNESIYKEYKMRSILDQNVFFAGRLGTYRYMNMDQIIKEALELFKQLKK